VFGTDVQTKRQPYAGDVPSSQVTTTAGAGSGSVLVRQFPHLAAKLADRETPTQGSSSSSSAANARNYLTQYISNITELQLPVQGTAADYWQQKLVANPQCAVPLVAQDVISAPASQAFVERLFSVCGLLTKGTRNRMEKSLYMRAWLKVNFEELKDML